MWRTITGAVACILLDACAVLTVDVDVYKGPMANEADVQTEQLASMAIAARPMLIQLRDRIECTHLGIDFKRVTQSTSASKFLDHPHVAIDEDVDPSEWALQSADARMINAVLSLYLDQVPKELAPYVARGREILAECRQHSATLSVTEDDRKLIEEIRSSLTPTSREHVTNFLVSTGPNGKRPAKALLDALAVGATVEADVGAFERLADADVSDAVAARVLKSEVDLNLKKRLAARLRAVGDAYHKGRILLDEAVELTLWFHIELAQTREDLRDAPLLLGRSARLCTLLIQPRNVAAVLGDPLWTASTKGQLQAELGSAVSTRNTWGPADFAAANNAIAAALVRRPIEIARWLLAAHESVREPRGAVEGLNLEQRKYGIARALTFSGDDRFEIEEAVGAFQAAVALLGRTGLDEGRTPKGLVTFIDDFRIARTKARAAAESAEGKSSSTQLRLDMELARDSLMVELVNFAQKVIFISGNDAVLRACDNPDGDCRKAYLMMLQSVGNTILTLSNEHVARYAALKASRERGAITLAAARSAWTLTPHEAIAEILHAIATFEGIPESALTAKSALDRAEADLARTRDAAIKACESARADVAASEAAQRKATDKLSGAKKELAAWFSGTTQSPDPTVTVLREEFAKREGKKALSAWFSALGDGLTAKARESGLPDDAKMRIEELQKSFASLKSEVLEKNEVPASEALGAIQVALEKRMQAARDGMDKAGKEVADAKARECTPDAVDKAAADARAEVSKRKTEFENVRSESRSRALAHAQSAASTAIQSLQVDNPASTDHATALAALDKALVDLWNGTTEEAAKADIRRSMGLIAALPLRSIQPDLDANGAGHSPVSATDVLDRVIATLSQELVAAQARGGASPESTRSMQEAIVQAYQVRSPLTYLRPPAAYLRNATPIPSLNTTAVGWQNLLADHGTRSFSSKDAAGHDIEVLREIDKQYWQNINRVRVAGMGKTSYVLAKDDIGNWSVKSYESDPESVIRGAQSIALAALSGQAGVDMFQRLDAVRKARADGEPYQPGESPTLIGKQVDSFAEKYLAAARKDSKELRDEATKVVVPLKEKLTAIRDSTDNKDLPLKLTSGDIAKAVTDAEAAKFKLASAPKDEAQALAEDCIAVMGKYLDLQEVLLTAFGDGKVVSTTQRDETAATHKQGQADVDAASAKHDVAAKVVDELTAALATDANSGALKAAVEKRDKAKAALETAAKNAAKLAETLASAEGNLSRARAVASELRGAVRAALGTKVEPVLQRRSKARESYATALEVLAQSNSDE